MSKKILTNRPANKISLQKLPNSYKKWDFFRKASFLKDLKRRKQLEDIILNKNSLKTIESLLPPYISSPYLSLSYEYFPLGRYGGDFFDVFWVDEDSIILYLFDISGHTEELGKIVLFLKFWMDKLPNESLKHPSLILNFLNEKITMQYDDFLYVSMWCCNINLSTLKLTFSSAEASVQYGFQRIKRRLTLLLELNLLYL